MCLVAYFVIETAEKVSRKRRRQWAKEALNEDEYIAELDARSGIAPSTSGPKVIQAFAFVYVCAFFVLICDESAAALLELQAVDVSIEPKRAEESMKSFKQRVREQTRQILLQEAKNRSSTAQKRKK